MSRPTIGDAAKRATVRLPNGRLATLIAVPRKGWTHGAKAKVQLPGGAYVAVPVDQLTVVGSAA